MLMKNKIKDILDKYEQCHSYMIPKNIFNRIKNHATYVHIKM